MKLKSLLVVLLALVVSLGAKAQEDKNLFNHLSVGVNAGTPGIGLDVAMPIGNYVQVRAGFATFPTIKVKTDFDIDLPEEARNFLHANGYTDIDNVEVEAKVGFTNGKLLFDVYPFKKSSFHLTVGAYFGSSDIVKLYNRENALLKGVAEFNTLVDRNQYPGVDKVGVELGDYLLTPNDEGNVEAKIKTASFKPYVGIGFGRAVPKKRLGFMTEIGCQFWGSPKVYCFDHQLTEQDVDGEDGGIIKTLSKVKVYPTISFRLCGRIF